MASIATDQGSLHYEVFGRGSPVILLHGYQGSWGLWQSTMEVLGAGHRTYAVDFWGFGESGARRSSYAINDFVSLVGQFIAQLGISRVPLVGHSMGGTVCLLMAAQHPECVDRVAAISAPLVGSSLRIFPRIFGWRWLAWLTYHNLGLYGKIYRLLARAYSSDPAWADMMDRDVSRTNLEAFFSSIRSLRRTDLRPLLPTLQMPVLGLYGARDNVVDPGQALVLKQYVPHAHIRLLPGSRHFPMLDEPGAFGRQLGAFLGA